MTTSQSPSTPPGPSFFQRSPLQVQAIQWPASVDPEDTKASVEFAQTTSAIFNWVNSAGGRIVWRDVKDDFYPAIVTAAGDLRVEDNDWVVRLPDVADPVTGKSTGEARFIVETPRDWAQDYQKQSRDLLGGQRDFLKQIEEIGKNAEEQEKYLTNEERQASTERLGDVVNKGGLAKPRGPIRDLRN